MAWCILGAAAVLMLGLVVGGVGGGAVCGSYVAAVYEHHPFLNPQPKVPLSRQEALEHMKLNLDVFEEQTAAAAKQGAQIIVFPEDGLHGFNFSRESIAGYLETVPDPTAVSWNPCSDPKFDAEIQHRLSCMAKNNKLYLVANLPEREDCDPQTPPCPPDGRYQFNTNVVFSADGALVARYRKRNLFSRECTYYDTPTDPQLITFDTPFAGCFGVFTCFDILFYNPAMELVEKLGVRQLVFPTAWFNEPPMMDAIQFHSSFSYATGTTLLAANIRLDAVGMTGSGIYTPSVALYHRAKQGDPKSGRLLVRTLPVLDSLRPHHQPQTLFPPSTGAQGPQSFQQGVGECKGAVPKWGHPMGHPKEPACSGSTFKAKIMHDLYTMRLVEGTEGRTSVCDNKLCCHLQFRRRTAPQELYALAAYDGWHVFYKRLALKVCALVKCSGLTPDSCGSPVDQADTLLDFQLKGNFSTPYVFPSVLSSQMTLDRPDHACREGRDFYMSRRGMERGLVTAALVGRVYDQDKCSP